MELSVSPASLLKLRAMQYRDIVPEDYDALSQLQSQPDQKLDPSLRAMLGKRFEAAATSAIEAEAEALAPTSDIVVLPTESVQMTLSPQCERCLICMDEMQAKEVLCSLACSHTFHADCLDGWLDHANQCPTCRDVLGESLVEP